MEVCRKMESLYTPSTSRQSLYSLLYTMRECIDAENTLAKAAALEKEAANTLRSCYLLAVKAHYSAYTDITLRTVAAKLKLILVKEMRASVKRTPFFTPHECWEITNSQLSQLSQEDLLQLIHLTKAEKGSGMWERINLYYATAGPKGGV